MKFLGLSFLLCAATFRAVAVTEADLCIYGGTSAAVAAAVQATRMGKSVVIVCPERHLGGLSSGGLGYTDTGDKSVIGGISLEFYQRIARRYRQPDAWKWQKAPELPAGADDLMGRWTFEPHVAEQVFEDFIREYKIPVYRGEWLKRTNGVQKVGSRIVSITTVDGRTYRAKIFLDATYEGDLMAAAGVEYEVGREANSVYGEQWNGIQPDAFHHRHRFGVLSQKISPYVIPGDSKSGVLPGISTEPPGRTGEGDKKIQAYCYRLCLTDNPANRVAFPKPEGYDPKQYELLLRIFQSGWRETFAKFDPIPNAKTDVNNHGPMSMDAIGANYDYPEASYERRREIAREHQRYQQGLLYFIANDPQVPRDVQEKMRTWGLAKDEFTDNGNWPHQLYVREARRMSGKFVMTENELLKKRPTPESVGMGSYGMDSHNVQRYIAADGSVQNEGDIGVSTRGPYQIAYGALVPKPGQCENLLVPVCASSSHIAYGSIRMEPVFMILGQSAATAAALAINDGVAVQQVPYAKLREQLLKDGQILEHSGGGAKSKTAVKEAAGLPRVLIIGDSISIGYTPVVQAALKGEADVRRIPGNGRMSANGLKLLSSWLGTQRWDVITFNFGLHDAKFLAPGKQQVPPAEYEANLRELVRRLQATGAKLVWCSTTPVPPGELVPSRQFSDIGEYNRIAIKVMTENHVVINDLNTFITPHVAEYQTKQDVHFAKAGYEALGGEVAAAIRAQLPKPAKQGNEP